MFYYYRLATYDERDNNFITLQDNLQGGPLIYCAYLDYICPTCRSFDRAALFTRKDGLERGPKIRVSKGRELAEARDGFLLIKNRVSELLQEHQVKGYESRPVPYTEWHVLRVTTRVPYRDFTPERTKPQCKTCGRGAYYGIASALSHIAVPEHDNTLFAPELERTNGYDVYLTQNVTELLKSSGVKGGLLTRLLDDEEYRLSCEGTPAARRKIKNLNVFLT
jgi:hypothetical protein